MKFQPGRGLEGSLIDDDAGARICPLEGHRDQRLLVIRVWFFIDEREAEAVRCLDGTENATDVEDVSTRGLHDEPVIPALDRFELKARDGESGGAEPVAKLFSVDERSKDPLPGYGKDLLEL